MSKNREQSWIVLKFGGTSVSEAAHWQAIAGILRGSEYDGHRLVVVHSALAGISDMLAALPDHATTGNGSDKITEIRDRHLKLAADLDLDGKALLAEEFATLDRLIEGLRLVGEASPRIRARIMALGELMATRLSAAWLAGAGHKVSWVDARSVLTSEAQPNKSERARFLSATCGRDHDPALAERFAELDGIILTQGFIASDPEGNDVLLGRGGSDTSAAYIAARLGAARLEIWTDVPGVFTADPHVVAGARLLNELRYQEIQEIASMGGSVLHPRAIPPARTHEIPVVVRSTLLPGCEGTRIAADVAYGAPQVKAISIRSGTVLVSMESLGMWHEVGFLADVFAIFRELGLSVDLISTSESNVTVTLDADVDTLDEDALALLRERLEGHCRVKIINRTAVVCLIGAKIRAILHEIGPALQVFEEHPIYMVSQSASDLNLSFVVDEDRAPQLANQLHATLIAKSRSPLFGPTVEALNKPLAAAAAPAEEWWATKRDALIEIAHEHSAAYVYDLSVVDGALARLSAMKNLDRGFYSIKANNQRDILDRVYQSGFGFECVSPGEVALVRDTFPDMDRQRILFTPNFAPREEYAAALAAGIPTTIDNLYALQHWADLFDGEEIFLRVDPGYRKGHHRHVRTGGRLAKFGIPLENLTDALKMADKAGARVIGLHAHVGSGIQEPATWQHIGEAILEAASEMPDLRSLNLGGGLGVAEKVGDVPLDLAELDAHLGVLKKLRPDIELWLEPGRYVVAEAGVLLTRVTQVKSKGDLNYVGVTTGMNSLIRPALYGSYHGIVNLTRLDEAASAMTTIVGPICESGDRLGTDRLLPRCREGDVILVATAGAYGAVMSSRYNLREPAVEVAI